MRTFYVYILASLSKTLYVGVTNDLEKRLFQHRSGERGFTAKYKINRLVYFEHTANSSAAIQREKEIKGWVRRKKLELVEKENPFWLDLAAGWSD